MALSLLVVAVGCSTPAKPDRQREEFARIELQLVATAESTRLSGHEDLLNLCCPRQGPYGVAGLYTPACRQVELILSTTNDAIALHGLVRYPWRVECLDTIDAGSLLSTLQRPVVDADPPLREKLYEIIEDYEPTPAMLDVVFAEYKRTIVDDDDAFYAAGRILADFDEHGLARLQRLMLEHPDVRARRLAVDALIGAATLPLDIPGLAAALDLATRDLDEGVATSARFAVSTLQRTEQAGLRASVAAGLEQLRVDVFGRRRLTCFMPEVERKLEEISRRNGLYDDRADPRRARLALAARRTYCRAPVGSAKAAER
ncbi:MAG: hypothetical protein WKG01_18295 [Kofleriaceae bacterium]